MECFEEGFLGHIVGICLAVEHLDEHGIELAAVASNQLVVCTRLAGKSARYELLIALVCIRISGVFLHFGRT